MRFRLRSLRKLTSGSGSWSTVQTQWFGVAQGHANLEVSAGCQSP